MSGASRRRGAEDSALRASILGAWNTSARVTERLVTHLPASIFPARIPGAPRRTVRMIAGHLHNARCMWLKTLGQPLGIPVPRSLDRHTVTRRQLQGALRRSARGIHDLLALGCDQGGRIPPTSAYRWRNLALDVGHVLTYFVAHEAHHRGQLILVARQLGCELPAAHRHELWQWKP